MKKIAFKFFKWRVEVKTKDLSSDKKIAFLANELIKELQKGGYQVAHPSIGKGFGSVQINVHRGEDVHIHTTRHDALKFSSTFGELEVFDDQDS